MLLATGCREVPTYDVTPTAKESMQEKMIGANRLIAKSEENQIDAYVQRRGWQMERIGDGVRVMVTGGRGGRQIEIDDTVTLCYSVLTLGGDTIYSHREEVVTVGRMKPTRGLDAALRTLHEDATATVIVPSEQAHGVLGDGDRIGSRTVLVYVVEVRERRS